MIMVAKISGQVNVGVAGADVISPKVGKSASPNIGSSGGSSSLSPNFGMVSSNIVGGNARLMPAKCPSSVGINSEGVDVSVASAVGMLADDCADVSVAGVVGMLPRVWETCKLGNEKLVSMYERARALGYFVLKKNRLDDLRACGTYLRFAELKGGGRKLAAASFCRMRLCPMCQWRRSLRLYAQVGTMLKALVSERPTVRYLFLTVTVRNVEVVGLGTALDVMTNSFIKLMKSPRLKKVVRGWIRCTEVTVNPYAGTTHPHIHAVLVVNSDYFTRNYLRQEEWAEMWAAALGVTYSPCVDIQAVKEKGRSAIAEVCGCFKYGTKRDGVVERLAEMGDYGVELLAGLTKTLHKRKFVSFGGVFNELRRRLNLGDLESLTDKTDVEAAEEAGLIEGYTKYRWECRQGVYVQL